MKQSVFILSLLLSFIMAPSASAATATSLRVQPLEYRDQLSVGEKKKGYIDVGNPTNERLRVSVAVQGFRQIDDTGRLQFFDDAQISSGLIPDLKEFELGPREVLRLYFLVDGGKLPTGDVFAALFATAKSSGPTGSVAQPVRIGTLFSITNGPPGPRSAEVQKVNTSFVQFSESIRGSYRIKNKAPATRSTGFTPTVLVSVSPLSAQKLIESPLVFAGRTREKSFELDGNRFGLYKMTVQYQDSKKSAWVFLVTGIWRWLVVAMLVGLLVWGGFKIRSQKQRPKSKLR